MYMKFFTSLILFGGVYGAYSNDANAAAAAAAKLASEVNGFSANQGIMGALGIQVDYGTLSKAVNALASNVKSDKDSDIDVAITKNFVSHIIQLLNGLGTKAADFAEVGAAGIVKNDLKGLYKPSQDIVSDITNIINKDCPKISALVDIVSSFAAAFTSVAQAYSIEPPKIQLISACAASSAAPASSQSSQPAAASSSSSSSAEVQPAPAPAPAPESSQPAAPPVPAPQSPKSPVISSAPESAGGSTGSSSGGSTGSSSGGSNGASSGGSTGSSSGSSSGEISGSSSGGSLESSSGGSTSSSSSGSDVVVVGGSNGSSSGGSNGSSSGGSNGASSGGSDGVVAGSSSVAAPVSSSATSQAGVLPPAAAPTSSSGSPAAAQSGSAPADTGASESEGPGNPDYVSAASNLASAASQLDSQINQFSSGAGINGALGIQGYFPTLSNNIVAFSSVVQGLHSSDIPVEVTKQFASAVTTLLDDLAKKAADFKAVHTSQIVTNDLQSINSPAAGIVSGLIGAFSSDCQRAVKLLPALESFEAAFSTAASAYGLSAPSFVVAPKCEGAGAPGSNAAPPKGSGSGIDQGQSNHNDIVTVVVSQFVTICSTPTTFAYNGKTYTATSDQTITVTDCPCTLTRSAPPGSNPSGSSPGSGLNPGAPKGASNSVQLANGFNKETYSILAIAAAAALPLLI